mgnify:CR=1 FL=1
MRNSETTLDVEVLLAMADLHPEDKLLWEKSAALFQLIPYANALLKEMLSEDRIVRPIIMKKIEFIKAATTKSQLKEILEPPKVQYNNNGTVSPIGPYSIPEEEMIIWMNTSLRGPMYDSGVSRYLELFKQIFPEYVDELGL